MTLTLNELGCGGGCSGLGDHLRVGPQVIPPASQSGVAVIQRGPHGKFFGKPLAPGRYEWWQEAEFPGKWTPQAVVTGVLGLGAAGKPEATTGTKATLTAQAIALFNQSRNRDLALVLRPQIQSALLTLGNFQPWTDSTDTWLSTSWLTTSARYSSSQTVRMNLQQALENVDIATGETSAGSPVSPSWRPQTETAHDVSVGDEFVKNVPSSVRETAEEQAKVYLKYALILGGLYVGATVGLPLLQGWARSKARRVSNPRRKRRSRRSR